VQILYAQDVVNNITSLLNAMMEKTGEKYAKTLPTLYKT